LSLEFALDLFLRTGQREADLVGIREVISNGVQTSNNEFFAYLGRKSLQFFVKLDEIGLVSALFAFF